MSTWWRITIDIYPYSVENNEADRKACGGERSFGRLVRAQDIHAAIQAANLIVAGIRINPRVWKAPIKGVVEYEGEIRDGVPYGPKTRGLLE